MRGRRYSLGALSAGRCRASGGLFSCLGRRGQWLRGQVYSWAGQCLRGSHGAGAREAPRLEDARHGDDFGGQAVLHVGVHAPSAAGNHKDDDRGCRGAHPVALPAYRLGPGQNAALGPCSIDSDSTPTAVRHAHDLQGRAARAAGQSAAEYLLRIWRRHRVPKVGEGSNSSQTPLMVKQVGH